MKSYSINYKFALISCTVVAAIIVLSSCKDTSNSVSTLDEIVFPATDISYEKQVQPLFNVGCAITGCHDKATNQNKNLDRTSFAGVRSNFGVVIPGDTTNSRLIWNIEARPGYAPMPPAKPLSQNQIQGLKRWILEGAKDTP